MSRLHPRDMAPRTLRRYVCGLCEQRLDRVKKNPKMCASMLLVPGEVCHWAQPKTWAREEAQ